MVPLLRPFLFCFGFIYISVQTLFLLGYSFFLSILFLVLIMVIWLVGGIVLVLFWILSGHLDVMKLPFVLGRTCCLDGLPPVFASLI